MPDPLPIPAVPPPPRLTYEQEPVPTRPPRWVLGVVGAYFACGVAMLTGASYFMTQERSVAWVGAGTLLAMLAAWAALLLVPVRVARRRPITRRSIWPPLIASGFAAALLILGAVLALGEVFNGGGDAFAWTAIGVASAGWVAWAVVFWAVARATSPQHVGMRLGRYLLAGSVLELLVAVPSHVYVRRRAECCAGIATATGICLGVAVMLVAFGPGVVMLYLKRVRQISNR